MNKDERSNHSKGKFIHSNTIHSFIHLDPVSIGFVNPQYNADQGFNEKGSNELSADPPPAAAMIKPYDGHPDSHVLSDMPQDDGPNQWAGFSDRAIRLAFVRYTLTHSRWPFIHSLYCLGKCMRSFQFNWHLRSH